MNRLTAILLLTLTLASCGNNGYGVTTSSPVAPVLSVTAISPNLGSTGGASLMTITGVGFKPGMSVTFDGIKVIGTFDSRDINFTILRLETPAHAAGPVDVVVTTNQLNSFGPSARVAAGTPTFHPTSLISTETGRLFL